MTSQLRLLILLALLLLLALPIRAAEPPLAVGAYLPDAELERGERTELVAAVFADHPTTARLELELPAGVASSCDCVRQLGPDQPGLVVVQLRIRADAPEGVTQVRVVVTDLESHTASDAMALRIGVMHWPAPRPPVRARLPIVRRG